MYSKDKKAKQAFKYFKENNISYYGFHILDENRYRAKGFVDSNVVVFTFIFTDDKMEIKTKKW